MAIPSYLQTASFLLAFCLGITTLAAAEDEPDIAELGEVVATASSPGPGLWRVSKGEHEMWVLGTLAPVPRKMKWDATLVQGVIDDAELILSPPSVKFDLKAGFFGSLFLIPSALSARNNPEKASLKDVLPQADYERWLRAKKAFIGRSASIERRRPLLAAQRLYEKALRKVGLNNDNISADVIKRAAKRNKLKLTTPQLEITLTDPKAMLNEFKSSSLNDVQCLRQTLSFVEQDLEAAKARAIAWAEGDIAALRKLPLTDRRVACAGAVLNSPAMRKRGYDDVPQRLRALWLDAAEAALKDHAVSFATIPMREVLDDDGYLAELSKRGYLVEAPASDIAPSPEAEEVERPNAPSVN